MTLPPSGCVTAFGRRGSGKTLWLWRQWFARCPRLLIVDSTGEWKTKLPHAVSTIGFDATIRGLQAMASVPEWTMTCYLDREEVIQLSKLLVPMGKQDRSFPVLVGGMAWCLDEVHRYVNPRRPTQLTDVWLVGRHSGLSMLAASQRPSNVSKDVTSQSDVVAIFALHEPNDVSYFTELMGREKAEEALSWANSAVRGSATHGRHTLYYPSSGQIDKREPIQVAEVAVPIGTGGME